MNKKRTGKVQTTDKGKKVKNKEREWMKSEKR